MRSINIDDMKNCEFVPLPFSPNVFVAVKKENLVEDFWGAVGDANQKGMRFSSEQVGQIKQQLGEP